LDSAEHFAQWTTGQLGQCRATESAVCTQVAAGGGRGQEVATDAKNYPRCQKLPQMPKITPDAKKCLGGLTFLLMYLVKAQAQFF
jgi:hypothetical protein